MKTASCSFTLTGVLLMSTASLSAFLGTNNASGTSRELSNIKYSSNAEAKCGQPSDQCHFCTVDRSMQNHVTIGAQHNYTHVNFMSSSPVTGYQTGVVASYKFEDAGYFLNFNFEGYWTTGRAVNEYFLRSNLTEYYSYFNFGHLFDIGKCFRFGPYGGVAYDGYNNTQSPGRPGLGYFFWKWQAVGGIQAYGYFGNYFSVGLTAEIRPDFYSRVHVAGHTFRLFRARSWRAQIPFTFYLNAPSHFNLQIIPFYDWNRFGATTEKNSSGVRFPIPKLTRWNLGLQLVVDFHF